MARLLKVDRNKTMIQLCITLLLNLATTLLLLLLRNVGFNEVNFVVVYILSVLITSSYTKGYRYGIIASIISMLSFNFFFTEPLLTLKVNDSTYILTFGIMLLSSLFTSTMASKLIRSRELANEREKQSHILYSITSSLAKTSDLQEAAQVSAICLSSLFEFKAACLIINQTEGTSTMYLSDGHSDDAICTEISSDKIKEAVLGYSIFPVKVRNRMISYVCIDPELEHKGHEYRFLLETVIMQITIAMERILLIRDKEAAKSETERERFKSSLLRAISHDIRTPLTRITGAAQMLQHSLDSKERNKLVASIYEDSSWLTRLVENILSLTRIQEGRLALHIQPEAVEEIISGAISQASKNSPEHRITICVPDEVLFVPMDGKLIEQVLINLISNSMEHSRPCDEIRVSVTPVPDVIWFEVRDSGTGIKEEDLPKIFEMFNVSGNTREGKRQGMGLGLAICRAIVNMHGGEIYAVNNKDKGTTFRFYLQR